MRDTCDGGGLTSRPLLPRLAIGILSFVALPAFAQGFELLGPTGAVAPDGFVVALAKRDAAGALTPVVDATVGSPDKSAAIVAGPPSGTLKTFLVSPSPGARRVTLRAEGQGGTVERVFEVGPPSLGIDVALSPAAPVKGRDKEAVLTIKLRGKEGELDFSPPVVVANVGRVSGLTRSGPGQYTAKYELPDTRYPEVAVLVAFAPWPHPLSVHGEVGTLLVPLATAIDLPGRTEPNASMSVEIAGKTFGPVQSGPDGRFELPVEVPPGVSRVMGTAIDKVGNRRRREMDLMLPKTDQLACVVSPRELPADGFAKARVICATTDAAGRRVTRAKVALTAERGQLSEVPTSGEFLEWRYQAPRGGAGPERLSASYKAGGPLSKETVELSLLQGPAASLSLRSREGLVHRGAALPLEVQVKDGFGQTRGQAAVRVDVVGEGRVEALRELDAGVHAGRYLAPDRSDAGSVALRARAFGPSGSAPARLWAYAADGGLHAAVTDLSGWPVPKQRLDVDGRAVETDESGQVLLGPVVPGRYELRHKEWPGLRHTVHVLEGGVVFPAQSNVLPTPVDLTVPFAPPIPVNVRLELSGAGGRCWAEDGEGRAVAGRTLTVMSAGAKLAGAVAAATGLTFGLAGAGGTVSCADQASGVTALAVVPR